MADETKTPDDYHVKTVENKLVSVHTREVSYTLYRYNIAHWILTDGLIKLQVRHPTKNTLQYFMKIQKGPPLAVLFERDRLKKTFREHTATITCYHELGWAVKQWVEPLLTTPLKKISKTKKHNT